MKFLFILLSLPDQYSNHDKPYLKTFSLDFSIECYLKNIYNI